MLNDQRTLFRIGYKVTLGRKAKLRFRVSRAHTKEIDAAFWLFGLILEC